MEKWTIKLYYRHRCVGVWGVSLQRKEAEMNHCMPWKCQGKWMSECLTRF